MSTTDATDSVSRQSQVNSSGNAPSHPGTRAEQTRQAQKAHCLSSVVQGLRPPAPAESEPCPQDHAQQPEQNRTDPSLLNATFSTRYKAHPTTQLFDWHVTYHNSAFTRPAKEMLAEAVRKAANG